MINICKAQYRYLRSGLRTSLKIPMGCSEAVNWRMRDNTWAKEKRANSDQQNVTQKMIYRAKRTSLKTQLNWQVRELFYKLSIAIKRTSNIPTDYRWTFGTFERHWNILDINENRNDVYQYKFIVILFLIGILFVYLNINNVNISSKSLSDVINKRIRKAVVVVIVW